MYSFSKNFAPNATLTVHVNHLKSEFDIRILNLHLSNAEYLEYLALFTF